MKKHETRLTLLSPEATAHLANCPAVELRRLAAEVARFALGAVGADPKLDLELIDAEERSKLRSRLQHEVESLDDAYFKLSQAHGAGAATEQEMLAAFSLARAFNAALLSVSSDPFEAASEAAYEAHAATNDLSGVLRVLGVLRGAPEPS